MSEEIKEDEVPEEELKAETGDETAPAESENTSTPEEKPVKSKKKPGKKKWIFLILIVVLIGVSGSGLVLMPEKFSFLNKNDFQYSEVSINEDNLSEESLSPFFIPPGPETKTIRIDLSIVWDGLASIRFKKKELGNRKMMYEIFYEKALQHEDLNEQKSYLENEVSSMLRKSLDAPNLVIRIKEIRYF